MIHRLSRNDRIFVAGHRGMVGSAIVRALRVQGFDNLLLRGRSELDLMDPSAVDAFYKAEKPDIVIDAAAKVGGIRANSTYPADFMRENLLIQMNVIDGPEARVKRLLFLGSSCIYPREAPQPMTEDVLLTSQLEKTNEAYALAKICGLKYCQFLRQQYGVLFHSAMPTNLYGPGDNYHPENSHVLPALIRRFHEAKEANAPEVVMWGTASAPRVPAHRRRRQRRPAPAPARKPRRTGSTWAAARTWKSASSRPSSRRSPATRARSPRPVQPDARRARVGHRLDPLHGWAPRIGLREGIAAPTRTS
jgi:hypothetical protein